LRSKPLRIGGIQRMAAQRAAERPDREAVDDDPPTRVQQQADALALLAETALHHGLDPTARSTRRATRSIDSPTARWGSGDRMAGRFPRLRLRPRCPMIRCRFSA
jgi:hypothetical protein